MLVSSQAKTSRHLFRLCAGFASRALEVASDTTQVSKLAEWSWLSFIGIVRAWTQRFAHVPAC